ncbi:hypothetical protein CRUP_038632, partial [Coryphaenoides rupestris]
MAGNKGSKVILLGFRLLFFVITQPDKVEAAERAAEELRKVEEAYEIANTEISDLKEKLNADYGPDREFLYLSTQCFQLKVYDEYTYTLCPFNQVSQTSDAGTEFLL